MIKLGIWTFLCVFVIINFLSDAYILNVKSSNGINKLNENSIKFYNNSGFVYNTQDVSERVLKAKCECENGHCVLGLSGEVTCACLPEFGLYSEKKCKACDCGKGANCTFHKGFFSTAKKCICPTDYKEVMGECVRPCTSNPCKNGEVCKVEGSDIKCDCKKTYNGKFCEKSPCSANPCKNNGFCEVEGYVFKCRCKSPFFGITCEKDPCSPNPCRNGGVCFKVENSFKCQCQSHFVGYTCDIECECENGRCVLGLSGEVTCACLPEFGLYSEKKCKACNCGKGANCTFHRGVRSTTKKCFCLRGFEEIRGRCVEITTATSSTGSWSKSTSDLTNLTNSPWWPTSKMTRMTPVYDASTQKSTLFVFTELTSGSTTDVNRTDLTSFETGVDILESTSTISSSTSEGAVYTNEQKSTTDSVPSVSVATSQEPESEKCEKNLCKNRGSCIKTKDGEVCTCQYPYAGRICEDSYWCSEGLGTKCPDGKCRFNFTSGVGYCECPKGNYFNYDKGKCESTDPCVLMTKKCSGWHEVCKNGKCECEENFKRNDKNECVANFCSSKPYPCGENEVCEDIPDDPRQVRCTCEEGYTFDGEKCQKSNECSLVGGLGCQHICNAAKMKCECYPGFTLQADKKSCSPNDARSTCKRDCGAGVCIKSKSKEKCVCPRTHISIGSTCIDLCTAKQLPPGLCPDKQCEADDKNGFRCKCEGKFEMDANGITCKKAQMCYAKGGSYVCYKSNAVCVEDFNSTKGYYCKCREGQEFDKNGRCRSKCDLDVHKEKCNQLSAICEMKGDEAICKCLPMLTFGADGRCTEFAKSSYVGALPIAQYNYESAVASTPREGLPRDAVHYAALRKDIRDAMQLLHGENFKFADLVSCTSDFPILSCTVEIQFKSDPKSQVQILGDPKICVNNDERTCVIPPRLVLLKDENHPVMFSRSDPCMKEIKDVNCGIGSSCSHAKDGSKNFVCQCGEGFINYGAVQPLSDKQTIIEKCEDINECLYPKVCPSKTTCLNTIGSYECLCPLGYRPASLTTDNRKTGCVEMCDPKLCKHGRCEINDNVFRCKCDEGYTGLNCDEEYINQDTINGLKIAIIVLSSIILPLTFLLIYLIQKYRMLKRKNKSSYMDEPNTFSMHQWR